MFRKTVVSMLTLVLLMITSACGGKLSSSQLAANTPVRGSLDVTSTSTYTDQFGLYHVVGAIQNNTASVQTGIELSAEIKDAAGNSLLKDSGVTTASVIFAPMLTSLAPKEISPFDYAYDTSNGTPATSSVSITAYQSGAANRAMLSAENVQLVDDSKGTLYLTGNLVNTGGQWVSIHSLAGSVVGGSENPLAAGSTIIHLGMLAPAGDSEQRDRTPFVISIPNPGPGQTDWRIYWDADLVGAPRDFSFGVNFTNSFFDQEGSYHIVGLVTNNSSTILAPALVAGLYAQDGTVLDAAYSFHPVAVGPGKGMPFDLSYFGSVNSSPTESARVRTFTVQVDPARTNPPTSQSVDLKAIGEQQQKDGAIWTFTGSVTNSTNNILSGVSVVVLVNDGQANLVASNSTYVLPVGDGIAPGDSVSYKVSVALDPTVDSSNFSTATLVRGDVGK
jgi:hypothetical protein